MKKITYLFILFILAVSINVRADDNNMMFEKANQLYHNKDYQGAATLYQQMIDDDYASADLFYNAGNAYYRLNKIGLSIWNYRKSLSLCKTKNTMDNLLLAQKRIKEPIASTKDIFFMRWWNIFRNLCSTNTWSFIALICFLIAILKLMLQKFYTQAQSFSWVQKACLIISFIATCMMFLQWNHEKNYFAAILIKEARDFKNNHIVSEGIEVEFVRKEKKGILIKLPNGATTVIESECIKRL
jgi:tetratricopeptide (TPR) repeat protein